MSGRSAIRRLAALVFLPAYSMLAFPLLVLAALWMFACWVATGKEQLASSPVSAFVFGPVYAPLKAVAEWAGLEAWS